MLAYAQGCIRQLWFMSFILCMLVDVLLVNVQILDRSDASNHLLHRLYVKMAVARLPNACIHAFMYKCMCS